MSTPKERNRSKRADGTNAGSAGGGRRLRRLRRGGGTLPATGVSIHSGLAEEPGNGGEPDAGLFRSRLSRARAVPRSIERGDVADADCGQPGARSRIERTPEVLETDAARFDRSGGGGVLDPGPADVAGTSGVGEGAGPGDLESHGKTTGAPAHGFSFALRRGHGASGDRQSDGAHRGNGQDAFIPGAGGSEEGNFMITHLSGEQISALLTGDGSGDEARHARECARCGDELDQMSAALGFFRGVVRRMAEREPVRFLVTSRPARRRETAAGLSSLVFHGAAIAGMLVVGSLTPVQTLVKSTIIPLIAPDLRPYKPDRRTEHGGGGGGTRSRMEAETGKLPKSAPRQYVPPQVDPAEN